MRIGITIILKTNNHMRSTLKATFAVFTTILMTAVSCNKEIAETQNPLLEKHTCEMKLVGSLVNFDGPDTRADANTTTWADGSIIYLRMNSPLGATTGEAIYNASKDVWTISYYGSLYEGVSNSCTALYLEDKVAYDNNIFTYDEGTAIYEDLDGSYIYDGGDLIVTANLSPKTGRIRFKGTPGSVLKVYGITHYTTYDISTDNYTTSATPFKTTVAENGYTPYLYGYFTDTDEPNIKLWIDAKEAYTRYCSNEIYNAGQSGQMTIPIVDSHNGWLNGLCFSINGERFNMIAVEGGTFIMGTSSSADEYNLAHSVTLTGFCVAETEMTKKLYNKLSGANTSDITPMLIARNNISSTIAKLNEFTNTEFNITSEAQWEFAAKGGVKSMGYTFAGGNTLNDVAWYKDNSDNKLHDVKTKLPNELGIYDMSGNSREFVLDYYNPYTNQSVTNPISTIDGDKGHTMRGGHYSSSEEICSSNYRYIHSYTTSTSQGWVTYYDTLECALRLVLNWD